MKNFGIWSFIEVCYELRSYDRDVAQLGSAGALVAYLFTNETNCNNKLSYFYYKLKSEEKRQNFSSAGDFVIISYSQTSTHIKSNIYPNPTCCRLISWPIFISLITPSFGGLIWGSKTPNQASFKGISIQIPFFRNHFSYASLKA